MKLEASLVGGGMTDEEDLVDADGGDSGLISRKLEPQNLPHQPAISYSWWVHLPELYLEMLENHISKVWIFTAIKSSSSSPSKQTLRSAP